MGQFREGRTRCRLDPILDEDSHCPTTPCFLLILLDLAFLVGGQQSNYSLFSVDPKPARLISSSDPARSGPIGSLGSLGKI